MYDLAVEDIQMFASNPEMSWRNRPIFRGYKKALVKHRLPNNLVTQPRTAQNTFVQVHDNVSLKISLFFNFQSWGGIFCLTTILL